MSAPDDRDRIEELRKANPVPVEELRASLTETDRRKARERVAMRISDDATGSAMPSGLLARRGFRVGVASALIGAVAVAVAVVDFDGSSIRPGPEPAYALAVVRAAEESPRVLVGLPGWSVKRADQFEADSGEIEFTDGEDNLGITWSPAAEYPQYPGGFGVEGRWFEINVGCTGCRFLRTTTIPVLGQDAEMNEFLTAKEGQGTRRDFDVSVPPSGVSYLYISAVGIERAKFLSVLDSLYETDVETWLAALPEQIVKPLERPEVVDEMLEGIPVPEGVDVEELRGQPAALSRYQLATKVTGAVACTWLDQWAEGMGSGDAAAEGEAIEAMATSRGWPILREIASEGGWSQVIWESADQMLSDPKLLLGSAGTELGPDGATYELRPGYATGLLCDSLQRIKIEEPAPPGNASGFEKKPVPDAVVARAIESAGGG